MPRYTRKNINSLRKTLKNKVSKKQYGSGYSFGVDQAPIAGQPEVVSYSDCGSVKVPAPIDQSVGNLVSSSGPAGGSCQDIPSSNTIQTALNAPKVPVMEYTNNAQVGGRKRKRKRKYRKNKYSKSKKSKTVKKVRKSKKSRKNKRK